MIWPSLPDTNANTMATPSEIVSSPDQNIVLHIMRTPSASLICHSIAPFMGFRIPNRLRFC